VIKLKRTTLVMLLGACLAAAGCGSDDEGDPIPQDSAAALQSQLDNVQERLDNGSVGACEDILSGPRGPNVDAVDQAISQLPEGVNADVRSALEDGFNRLFTLVEDRCNELREEEESQQETDTTEEPPAVIETETETVPPPETETTPPPDTETVPPPETETLPPPTDEAPPEGGEEGNGGDGGVLAPEGDQG
jgi:hypothetical protein